jgi:chloramphenicol O-acetyltransferase type A
MEQPQLNLTAPVEVDSLLPYVKEQALPLSPVLVYLISKTANELPAFRQRIRGEQVIEHDCVHPSFTVRTRASSVFSFCPVEFQPQLASFLPACLAAMERVQQVPVFEDEDGRDDYLFLSALPWVSFTHVQHAMHYHPVDSIPRIAWGKYTLRDQKMEMPLQVQAHHALVDGIDIGRFFETFQAYCKHPANIF